MQKHYGFPRSEKLKSVARTGLLFSSGKSFWIFPCSVYYRIGGKPELQKSQILVSVGKHYFKHAVDRNRMKRLLRESFRLHKHRLMEAAQEAGLCFNMALVYKSRNLMGFAAVEASMLAILARMEEIVRKAAQKP